MTPARRPRTRPAGKAAPDPQILLPRLRARLGRERAALGRWQKRLLRVFHAWEKQSRRIARLERQIAKLEAV